MWAPVVSLQGAHSDRPDATALPVGTLWDCDTHGLVYRTDGTGWSTFAGKAAADYVPLANGDPDAPAYLFTPAGDGIYVEDSTP